MKCTLRKTEQGVVATIDERPKEGDWVLDYGVCCIYIDGDVMIDNGQFKTIIASTFGVGKEIYIEYFGWAGSDTMELDNFVKVWEIGGKEPIDYNKEYTYTETETQIIIKL